jgi:hypothetical protein
MDLVRLSGGLLVNNKNIKKKKRKEALKLRFLFRWKRKFQRDDAQHTHILLSIPQSARTFVNYDRGGRKSRKKNGQWAVRVGSPSNTTPTAVAAAFYISFFFCFSLIPHADNSTISLVSIVFFSINFSPSFRDWQQSDRWTESIWVVASNS